MLRCVDAQLLEEVDHVPITSLQARRVAEAQYHRASRQPFEFKHLQITFADPITRVLSEYATIVPCDSLALVRWFVDGIWFCTHPKVEICAVKPKQLMPGPYQMEREDFTLGLSGVIISGDQLE